MRSRSASINALFIAAPWQHHQKLVHPRPPQQIVAAQQPRRPRRHLDQQFVARIRAQPRIPVPEIVNVKQHQAQRTVQPLHPVRLPKQHGQQRLAVIHPRQPVQLRVQRGCIAQRLQLVRQYVRAQHHGPAEAANKPSPRRAESGRQSRPPPAGRSTPLSQCPKSGQSGTAPPRLRPHRRQQLPHRHARKSHIQQRQCRRIRRPSLRQRRLLPKEPLPPALPPPAAPAQQPPAAPAREEASRNVDVVACTCIRKSLRTGCIGKD